MFKKISLLIAFMAAMVMSVSAQENIYMIKGDKVVAKFNANDVDYMSFELPEGVKDLEKLAVEVQETGKNYITYSVTTDDQSKNYAHAVFLESFLNYVLMEYCETTLEDATPELLAYGIRLCINSYGYLGKGNQTFTMKDGEKDDSGYEFSILAGQKYIVAACEIEGDDLGETYAQTAAQTLQAGVSPEVLNVEYAGLTEKNGAMFNFTFGDNITSVFTMFGYRDVLEPYINTYGYETTMFTFGGLFDPETLKNDTEGWTIDEEAEYIMYVLGIDKNGDWVKAQCIQTIKPSASEAQGPKITIFSKQKGDGKVSVNFEISPSNVTEAYVRLMSEDNADDRLNMGYTLAELAAGGDAIDITNDINTAGEYTYVNNEVDNSWQSLLIMGKNNDGTTVTRINFHAHIDGSQWDVNENVNMAPSSNAKKQTVCRKPVSPKAAQLNAIKGNNFRKTFKMMK